MSVVNCEGNVFFVVIFCDFCEWGVIFDDDNVFRIDVLHTEVSSVRFRGR